MYMMAASFEPRAFLLYAFVFLWQFLFMRCVLIGGVRTEWQTYPIFRPAVASKEHGTGSDS